MSFLSLGKGEKLSFVGMLLLIAVVLSSLSGRLLPEEALINAAAEPGRACDLGLAGTSCALSGGICAWPLAYGPLLVMRGEGDLSSDDSITEAADPASAEGLGFVGGDDIFGFSCTFATLSWLLDARLF